MAEKPTITITITKKQQLEVLAATGLRVSVLEVPVAMLTDGGEALARLPLPEWVKLAGASTATAQEENADV